MALTEIKPMRGEYLYDRDGDCVGKWNGERGMFSDCFVVRMRTCCMLPVQGGGYGCDSCYTWFDDIKEKPRYCPNCGAKVVD